MWAHAAGCTRSGAQLLTVQNRQTVNIPAQQYIRPCRPARRQVRVRAEKLTGSGSENFHEPEELNLVSTLLHALWRFKAMRISS